MVAIGYTIMGEQAGPKQLVADAVRAEEVGFDFLAASDHYSPWLAEQGHSPYTWSVLGAVSQATERIELMTYVTCPTMRYHPAVVAQKAATIQLLSDGRFTLGLGAGENLNEHVVGRAWPPVDVRHEMLVESLEIIRPLLQGETVTFRGTHLSTEGAKLWDLPDEAPRIGLAVSGPRSCQLAGKYADAMIAVQPEADLGAQFDAAGGGGKPRIGQVGLSYDPDEAVATKRALEQFRWFTGGWDVMAELPGPRHFASASQSVREEDIADQVPCGPDVARHVAAVQQFVDAGFTHVAVVQIGGDTQSAFFDWARAELLPELRRLG
ncbi:MAG: F420-dependent glucose-6-phosphate dehydrogenase [uncultured Acidimicrobiales bacterium]|uniref:F420-dependent glucose-6-phosphate dehydrogenase n=1 Tax=uncultured Acidimicrobiales bacterium TaxID=310071 RepID=A0A6J4ILP1_9ACTN|nr:MAG: F420-dependent glucose-6-phosphate dehydrogenase [uncultured Acidimicrobiales bacterium]